MLSLWMAPADGRAQGFFDSAAPPEFGISPAQPPVGQPLSLGAAPVAPALSGALGLGLLLVLGAAAGGGGDDGGGGGVAPPTEADPRWTGPLFQGCRTSDPARAALETGEYAANPGLGVICAAQQHAWGRTGAGVNVGVFDNGFSTYHKDLRHAFGTEAGDNALRVFDGYDEHPDWVNDGNHGTHVAGTIAAARNGTGIVGVAPDANLFGIRGLTAYADPDARYTGHKYDPEAPGTIDPFDLIFSSGLRWAADNGVAAMNHSWGFTDGRNSITLAELGTLDAVADFLGPSIYSALDATINGGSLFVTRYDTTARRFVLDTATVPGGMVHVFAAGNSTLTEPGVFAGLSYYGSAETGFKNHIVHVVSVDPDGVLSDFSNQCGLAMEYCLAAPGGSIYSTVQQRDVYATDGTFLRTDFETYDVYSGTSMAAPHVTGAIAALVSASPEITGAVALQILKDTAIDLGAPGVDDVFGHGLINLESAAAPQGVLSVQMTPRLGEDARPATASAVMAGGGLAGSLARTLSAQPMIVTDRYARGFHVDAGAFVAEADDTGALRDRVATFSTAETRVLRHADAAGEIRFSPWGAEALAPAGTLGDIHAPEAALLGGSAALAWRAGLGGGLTGTLALAGPIGAGDGGATGARYLGGTLEMGLAPGAAITLGAGLLRESGGFLGSDLAGAFGGSVRAETAFVSLGAGFEHDRSAFRVSYTGGTTDFSGDGLLRAGTDLGTRSLGLSWERSDARGGRLGLGLRRALDVTGGELRMVVPVARVAAEGPSVSSAVVMQRSALPVAEATAPTDIELRYSLPAGRGHFGVAVTHRLDGDMTVAGVGYRIRF